MTKLYYVAHPYTPKDGVTEEDNVAHNIEVTNKLMDWGYHIYAPIIMTHYLHLAKYRDYKFWIEEDEVIMERCDGIILTGNWRQSSGCLGEKKFFEKRGKEVLFYRELFRKHEEPTFDEYVYDDSCMICGKFTKVCSGTACCKKCDGEE